MKPNSAATRRLLTDSAREYHQNLLDKGAEHPAWEFIRERGLDHGTVDYFQLGWVDTPFNHEHQQFRGRLSIPNLIVDQDGEIRPVGLKFRLLDWGGKEDGRPKFNTPMHQPARLYNLRDIGRATDTICVTEGESDAWVINHAGYPVVAIPGANNMGKAFAYRRRIFDGFARVILLRDSDEAGETLVKELTTIDGLEVRNPLPHKDMSELFDAEGVEAVAALIEGEA